MILGFESFAVLTEMGLSPLFFLNRMQLDSDPFLHDRSCQDRENRDWT